MPAPTEFYDHRDTDYASALADAEPDADVIFGPNREGFIWYIERINWHLQAHTAVVKVFVTTGEAPDPLEAGRQDFSAALQDGSRDYLNPLVVPPGYRVIVNFTGGTLAQNDLCVATIQRAWCLTNAGSAYGALGPDDHRALMEQELVEDSERRSAVVVGGSGWQFSNDPAGYDPRGEVNQDNVLANAIQPYTDSVQDRTGMGVDDPSAFNAPDPRIPFIGQYVGPNRYGPQHPSAPYPRPTIASSGSQESDSFGTQLAGVVGKLLGRTDPQGRPIPSDPEGGTQ